MAKLPETIGVDVKLVPFAPVVPDAGTKGHSLVKYLAATEWAILPEKLEQIEAVVAQFVAGTNVALANTPTAVRNAGQVAVIPVEGTITKRAYGLDAFSGVRTTLDVKNDIQAALDNSAVSGIVLSIDSPGGTVDGTKELADFIKMATNSKPIVAYADGTMASAAYWLGSAASRIVAFDTAKVGSVGVVVSHQDRSEADKAAGIKTTYIYQGKYKVSGNSTEPLTTESKEYIQGHVDTYYSIFVDAVAENRGIERSKVISDIALGAVFIGKAALDLNLVDSIGTLEDAINLALTLGEETMADEKIQEQLDAMTTQMATMADQLKTSLDTNIKLQETVDSQVADSEARDKADAAKIHLEEITEKCAGLGLSEEVIGSFAALDEKSFGTVLTEISGRQTKLDETLAALGKPTEDATSESDDLSVASIDDATEAIMKRDNCDIDDALVTAQTEYPDLFKI